MYRFPGKRSEAISGFEPQVVLISEAHRRYSVRTDKGKSGISVRRNKRRKVGPGPSGPDETKGKSVMMTSRLKR
jgi:hypothetical protein